MSALIGTVSPGCLFCVLLLPLEIEGAGLVLTQGDHACFDFISDCFRVRGVVVSWRSDPSSAGIPISYQNDQNFDTHTTVHNL